GWSPDASITVLDELAHKGEIQHPIQVAIEVIRGHQLLEGDGRQGREVPRFLPHHGDSPFLPPLGGDQRDPITTWACCPAATNLLTRKPVDSLQEAFYNTLENKRDAGDAGAA